MSCQVFLCFVVLFVFWRIWFLVAVWGGLLYCKGRFELVWLSFAWGIRCHTGHRVASKGFLKHLPFFYISRSLWSQKDGLDLLEIVGDVVGDLVEALLGHLKYIIMLYINIVISLYINAIYLNHNTAQAPAASSWWARTQGRRRPRRLCRSSLRWATGTPRSPRPERDQVHKVPDRAILLRILITRRDEKIW